MKKLRALPLLLSLVCLFLIYRHFQPDTFFSNLGLSIPQSEITSHQHGDWLSDAEDHLLILDIPATQWPQTLAQWKTTSPKGLKPQTLSQLFMEGNYYSDVTPNLKTHYRDFLAGYEQFFPSRPAKATAGEFRVLGRGGNEYRCRFLRDETTGRVWFLGRMLPPH